MNEADAPIGGSEGLELTPTMSRERARALLAARLAREGLDGAQLDARVLVCAACGIDHARFVRDPGLPLGPAAERLLAMARRRLAREPVSRILGHREFWGLPFSVSRAVLDPRPETEGVVGAALDAIGGRRTAPLRLLDLGTGSGALLCALLHELPGAQGVGVDRSADACKMARANAVALGLAPRAMIICASWTDALGGRFDLIVSNPPYIPHRDLERLAPEVRNHDPVAALDGGSDGMEAYRSIARCLGDRLMPTGIAVFECGHDQGADVAAILQTALAEVRVLKDLAGLDRVVLGLRP